MIASNYSDLIQQVVGQLADEGLVQSSVIVTGKTGWTITMDDRVSVNVTCRAGKMILGQAPDEITLGWFWGQWGPALQAHLRAAVGRAA